MPSGTDVSTAAAITAPSTNVWNASPTITSDAAVLWTWQSSSSWQCRQITAFSSRKKLRMPAASVSIATRGESCVERLRHERQQRDAEQRADRVADQPRHETQTQTVRRAAGRSTPTSNPAEAAEDAEADRDEQNHASIIVGCHAGVICAHRPPRSLAARARGTRSAAPRRGSCASARPSRPAPRSPGSTAGSTRRRCRPSPDRDRAA